MQRFLSVSFLMLAAAAFSTQTASAQYPDAGGLGFFPYGFYQPYGARYGTALRTPPYFATNPPVYYGARHARPYGLSPFAAPPQVQAAPNYQSRLRSQFLEPRVPTPTPLCNPYVTGSAPPKLESKLGAIQENPFVEPIDRIAAK